MRICATIWCCRRRVGVTGGSPAPRRWAGLDRAADRAWAWAAHVSMAETFIASFDGAPEEWVLDFDATDDAVHGRQVGRFFHGDYDGDCFLPLYVFCGDHLVVSYLRPSNIDGAKHAWAILALLVKRLRQAWPDVRITLRADSGFCRDPMPIPRSGALHLSTACPDKARFHRAAAKLKPG